MIVAPRTRPPYVGPRPFDAGDADRFFGRDREVDDLFDLLIARRLVLLHSPSGAGKSSLIQAKLIPRLIEEGLAINPSIRVGAAEAVGLGQNRYVTATLLALGGSVQPEAGAVPTLAAYLAERSPAPAAEVFIFDQFEEVLTADPLDERGREEFFRQLGVALNDDRRWACFGLREDHLGALRPLLHYLPTRLSSTFRLNLLSAAQAREAIQKPAAAAGVDFTAAAAERLVDDLRRTVGLAKGRGALDAPGPTVEPVQLQVVALRLWQQRFGGTSPPPQSVIGVADIERMGNVNQALADYYDEKVAAIAAAAGVSERPIRAWFDEQLITADGRRDQVLRQDEQSAGLSNELIDRLVDAYLVRGEERRGAIWYELTHDRLIAPIGESNKAWADESLTTFQKQAALWAAGQRLPGLLLRGEALVEAEAWAREHASELTGDEDEFLRASLAEQAAREREAQRRRWTLAVAISVAVIFAILSAFAIGQWQAALEAARNAQVRQFAAQALAEGELLPQRSLLVALEAVGQQRVDDMSRQSADRSLRAALATVGGWPLRGHQGPVRAVAFSPGGGWIATAGDDTTVRLWPATTLQPTPLFLPGHGGPVVALAFISEQELISASEDGTVRRWQVERPAEAPAVLRGHKGPIVALASDPARSLLLTASSDRTVRSWDRALPTDAQAVLEGHLAELVAVALSPDGRWLASADRDGLVLLRRRDEPEQIAAELRVGGTSPIATDLSFSPDSALLAVAGSGQAGPASGAAWIWEVREGEQTPLVYGGHSQIVQAVAFSRDGGSLATMSLDNTARLWTVGNTGAPSADLRGHTDRVTAGAFSPDGRWLATASVDGVARLWAVGAPASAPIVLRGHAGAITAVSFSPDGRRLITASVDGTARIWQTGLASATPELRTGHTGQPASVALSPDGRWIASAGFGEPTFLWSIAEPGGAPIDLDADDEPRFGVSLAFSPDSGLLVAGDFDSAEIRRWDVAGARPMPLAPLTSTVAVSGLAFSPENELLVGGRDGSLARFSLASGAGPPDVRPGHSSDVLVMATAPANSRRLATGGFDGRVLLWDLAAPAGAGPRVLGNHGDLPIRALRFSLDGQLLAAGGDDDTVRVYALDDPDAEPILLGGAGGHTDGVTALAFHPDDPATLATASNDRTVRIWRIHAPAQAESALAHGSEVLDLAFDDTGELLATAAGDRLTRVYALAELGREPLTLRGHSDKVTKVTFMADGRLLTASTDRQIRLWEVRLDRLRELACATAGRNLSLQEWQELYGENTPYAKTCTTISDHPDVFAEHLETGSFAEALAHYEAERERDKATESPAAWLVRAASSLFRQGRTMEALDAFARAKAIEPGLLSADTMILNAICIDAAVQSLETALAACDAAIERNAVFGTFRFNRGNLRRAKDDLQGARDDLCAFVAWADANQVTDAKGFVAQATQTIAALEPMTGPCPSPTP